MIPEEPTTPDLAAAIEALRAEFYEYRTSLAGTLRSILESVSRPSDPKETAREITQMLTPILSVGRRDIVLGDEASDQATASLSIINERLRSLDETIRALQGFRGEVVSALGSVGEEVGARADRWLESFDTSASALRERVEQLALLIDSSTAAVQTVVRSQVERLSAPVDELARATQALSGLPASVKEVLGQFEAITAVGVTLEQTPAQIGTLAQRIVELTNTIEHLRERTPLDGDIAEPTGTLAEQMAEIREDIQALSEHTSRSLRALSDRPSTTAEDLRAVTEPATEALRARFERAAEHLDARADQLQDAIRSTAFTDQVRELAAQNESQIRAAVDRSDKRLGEVLRQLTVTISGLDQIWKRMDVFDARLTQIDARVGIASRAKAPKAGLFRRKEKQTRIAQPEPPTTLSMLNDRPAKDIVESPPQPPPVRSVAAPVKGEPKPAPKSRPRAPHKPQKTTSKPRASKPLRAQDIPVDKPARASAKDKKSEPKPRAPRKLPKSPPEA